MNKVPEISVITACYNHGKYIGEMIGSVLKSTFQDFELIIVNDGSTDNTAEILGNFRNEKIRIYHTANNGPAAARNLAIENAEGEIIMNLDADDMIAPSLLEKAYDLFRLNPDAGIVYSDAECFGARNGKYEIGEYSIENMLSDNRIISQAFFRKKDWKIVGGYSGELIFGLEDWDFWLSVIELGRGIYKVPEKLVYYRTYKKETDCRSGRRKNNRLKLLKSRLWIFRRHFDLYRKYPEAMKLLSRLEKHLESETVLTREARDLYFNLRRIINI